MSLYTAIIGTTTFALVSGGLFVGYLHLERWYWRAALLRRLSGTGTSPMDIVRPLLQGLRRLLLRLGEAAMPADETEITDRRRLLSFAGYRSRRALLLYYGSKILLALSLGGGYLMLLLLAGPPGLRDLIFVFFPLAAGYYLPGVVLRYLVDKRKQQIFHELPDTLDLLLICMEAGLSFDTALQRVSRELSAIAPVLSRELGRYYYEIKSGLSRETVLKNLAERNGERSLTNVVQVLIQSLRFGTDIAEALRVYSDSLRTERMRVAEEKGAKISTKLTFPMILLILPALMIVILGPALINLMERMY
ncbi:type II secretion system F family protein [uncultured Desulfosarcina sp.]|uniref:type II secretion system F family protein n=1 Tax=uncultured Desulfosarcina sp. TaxID=218289 RepID=UPI0029C748F6|nr:type II secretion system F family protein [uncultured Desulfosarcina sp.]